MGREIAQRTGSVPVTVDGLHYCYNPTRIGLASLAVFHPHERRGGEAAKRTAVKLERRWSGGALINGVVSLPPSSRIPTNPELSLFPSLTRATL